MLARRAARGHVCIACAHDGVVTACELGQGGGHPDGLCAHWLCFDCQDDYSRPTLCPCGVDAAFARDEQAANIDTGDAFRHVDDMLCAAAA